MTNYNAKQAKRIVEMLTAEKVDNENITRLLNYHYSEETFTNDQRHKRIMRVDEQGTWHNV